MNREVGGDLLDRHPVLAVTGDPHDILTELSGVGPGHSNILPARPPGQANSDVTCSCSRPNKLLFQVLTEREERSAIAIASNEPFSAWTKTFTDPRLCAAIVDRLTFAGQIIETGTHSYRLSHARNAQPP